MDGYTVEDALEEFSQLMAKFKEFGISTLVVVSTHDPFDGGNPTNFQVSGNAYEVLYAAHQALKYYEQSESFTEF